MNFINITNKSIQYSEMTRCTINLFSIDMHLSFLSEEEAKENYFILKKEINNKVQVTLHGRKFNFILKECYLDSKIIIMKGQIKQ